MHHTFQRILLAADKQGITYLKLISSHLKSKGFEYNVLQDPDDQALYKILAQQILSSPQNIGILLAGSGIRANIQLNKKKGIRAALTHTNYIADMCRKHNDANVMVVPTYCLGVPLVTSIIDTFMGSGFDGQPRNQKRLELVREIQQSNGKPNEL